MRQAILPVRGFFPAFLAVANPGVEDPAAGVPSSPTPGVVIVDERAPPSVDPEQPPPIYAGGKSGASGGCDGANPDPSCSVDLSDLFPPAGNQGAHASCLAFAIGRHLRTFAAKHDAQYLKLSGERPVIYSAGFMYDVLVKKRNVPVIPRCVVNLPVSEAVNFILTNGTLPEHAYEKFDNSGPDSCNPHTPAPNEEELAKLALLERDMKRLELRDASPATIIDAFQAHLSNKRPLLVVLRVNWSEFRPGKRPPLTQGLLPATAFNKLRGVAHALVVVGYDDTLQAFKVLNSAGPEWGEQGYAFIDYGHFVEALEPGAVYYLGGPNEAATRALIDIDAVVNTGSMTLDVGARGEFLDYTPPGAELSIFASRLNCDAPSCRVRLATHPVEPAGKSAFTVAKFSVALDSEPLASLKGASVYVTSTIVFDGDHRTLEARIAPGVSHSPKKIVHLK
jgi:hypothetical protein